MKFKQLLLLLNLNLIIYNDSAFVVDNYDEKKVREEITDIKYSALNEIQKDMIKLTIIDELNNEMNINGFVKYIDGKYYVVFLKSLYTKPIGRIKTIKYIYKNNLVTLSNIETIKSVYKNILIGVELKSDNTKNEYMWLIRYFIYGIYDFDLLKVDRTLIKNKHYSKNEIDIQLKESRLGNLSDFYTENLLKSNVKLSFVFASTSISNENWYIVGKIDGIKDNQLRIVPISYIDKEIDFNVLYEDTTISKYFLSLNAKKFNNDDVGSYLIHITKTEIPIIYAQITKVRTSEFGKQIIFIQPFRNKITIPSILSYGKIISESINSDAHLEPSDQVIEEEPLSTPVGSPHPQPVFTEDELAPHSKRPRLDTVSEIEKFTCGNIYLKGIYILKSRNIIINVDNIYPDNFLSTTNNKDLYKISGNYTYKYVTRNFNECHKGNDVDENDDYLVSYENGQEIRIYPNLLELHNTN